MNASFNAPTEETDDNVDTGDLELRLITDRSSPDILQKIVEFESVHPIAGESDLKNRMDEDRRLYGFFHKGASNDLVAFVEVALIKGRCGSVQELLDVTAPLGDAKAADRAIFYSINNARKGLVRNSSGGLLIKAVCGELQKQFPKLAYFSTLSPIPGFCDWLEDRLKDGEGAILSSEEKTGIAAVAGEENGFQALLASSWRGDAKAEQALKAPLTRLCAQYLIGRIQKGRRPPRVIDAVGNFHLSNGAFVERVNWLGDVSEKGMKQSAGLMVNYLYDLSKTGVYGQAYRERGEIPASSEVRMLAAPNGI